jgi:hypothetical protein
VNGRSVVLLGLTSIALVCGRQRALEAQGCQPPSSKRFDPEVVKQRGYNLCWAASDVMVMNSVQANATSLCTHVQEVIRPDGAACCANSTGVPFLVCDQPNTPRKALPKARFACRYSDSVLSWDAVKWQLGCVKTPFIFEWGVGASIHEMVADGYKTTSGMPLVHVIDPLLGDGAWIPYRFWSGNGGPRGSSLVGRLAKKLTKNSSSTIDHLRDFHDVTRAGTAAPTCPKDP